MSYDIRLVGAEDTRINVIHLELLEPARCFV